MNERDLLREGLTAAVSGSSRGRVVADELCGACVELLDVDGAALSVIYEGTMTRSFGASSELSRELDELQFTLGEGPCLDAVRSTSVIIARDLDADLPERWPAFSAAAVRRGARTILAFPVAVADIAIGALDLYCIDPSEPDPRTVRGGYIAAELAAVPLLDLMGIDLTAAVADETSTAWDELTALMRVEVYQASGMLITQLGVSASEALVRLRAYAYAHELTASEVAHKIIDGSLVLPDDYDRPAQPDPAGDLDGS